LPMHKQEVGVCTSRKLECSWKGWSTKLEELSSRPAQIEWMEEITMTSSSQLDPLFGAQSLTNARNEYHAVESCNEQLG
jgi:hypothetical protein